MTERLIALERDGTLRLYSVNGGAPAEVGHLVVGRLDDAHAAIVAAAFSDLREAVTNGQLGRAEPVTPHGLERYLPEPPRSGIRAALPSARPVAAVRDVKHYNGGAPGMRTRNRKGQPSLNGRVYNYLAEHGPCTVQEVLDALGPEPSATKSARQRLSTALASLKSQGRLAHVGNRWLINGDAT